VILIAIFILAELAAFLTYQNFVSSPLRLFIPYPAEMLLFALPIIGVLFKKPFSLQFYILLLFFNISPILPGSETFEGVVDTLNAVDSVFSTGTGKIAEALKEAFAECKGGFEVLLLVTWLYIVAEVLQGVAESLSKAKQNCVPIENAFIAYLAAMVFSAILYFLYLTTTNFQPEIAVGRTISAVIGVAAFFAGIYLLSKSAEEEDINSAA